MFPVPTRLTAAALGLLVWTACATQQRSPASAPAAAPAEAPAAKPARPALASLQPPDGVWLRDEEGREYFLDRVEKGPNTFQRIDDTHVRSVYGVVLTVEMEDDTYFYYRYYRPVDTPSVKSSEPSPEAVASYVAGTDTVDRLTFVAATSGLPAAGQWRNQFDLADMNEDGQLDLVHGPPRKSPDRRPVIFLGDGKGQWRRWKEARFPAASYDYGAAAAGDFDGDGHRDLALGVHLHGLLALLGDGRGGFRLVGEGLDFSPGPPDRFSSTALIATDWDGDGRDDIVALGEGPRLPMPDMPPEVRKALGLTVYSLGPDGVWQHRDEGSAAMLFGNGLASGDFNGDGIRDAATTSGVLGRRDILRLGLGGGEWQPATVDSVRPRAYVRAITVGDFDGDRRDDLAVSFITWELGPARVGIDILLARAKEKEPVQWERHPLWGREGRQEATALAAGDLDGDGRADIVGLTEEGETLVFLGEGGGRFARESAPEFGLSTDGCRGYHVMLKDLDRDGRDDVVSEFAGGEDAMFAPGRCKAQGRLEAWSTTLGAGSKRP
jgi:hypothetical protein